MSLAQGAGMFGISEFHVQFYHKTQGIETENCGNNKKEVYSRQKGAVPLCSYEHKRTAPVCLTNISRKLHLGSLCIESNAVNQLLFIAFRNSFIVAFFKDLPDSNLAVSIKLFFLLRPLKFQKQDRSFPTIFDSQIQPTKTGFII